MVPMLVNENRIIYLAFLLTLILHLGLVSPLSHWLDRTLLPRFSGESLEIDINEIRSNPPPPFKANPPELKVPKPIPEKKKALQPPHPPKLQEPEVPDVDPLLKETNETLPAAKEKKQLSLHAAEDSEIDNGGKPLPLTPKTPESKRGQEPASTNRPDLASDDVKKTDKTESPAPTEEKKVLLKEDEGDSEPISSPLFLKKDESNQAEAEKKPGPPDEVVESFRNGKPEETSLENLQYSMNSYQWTFERFIDNWVVDIQKWWKAPIDYVTGKMPEGGDLWVQVHLGHSGKLLSYKVIRSEVTPEMELRAIQALIGSLKRPELPPSFSESALIINWRFIYPPLRPPIRMRR